MRWSLLNTDSRLYAFLIEAIDEYGLLAIIEFQILYVPTDGSVSCTLNIEDGIIHDTLLLDSNLYEIPIVKANGYYEYSSVYLPGDMNFDGKVDIKDIAIAALAFGSYPGHPGWNPLADTNGDNKVDIKDIAFIASNFGKTSL